MNSTFDFNDINKLIEFDQDPKRKLAWISEKDPLKLTEALFLSVDKLPDSHPDVNCLTSFVLELSQIIDNLDTKSLEQIDQILCVKLLEKYPSPPSTFGVS